MSERIAFEVADLDLAKTRVVECLTLAGDMMDLSVCSEVKRVR